jgi:hypothetical protein
MRKIAEGVNEMEGVVTAAAHLFAALVTELPEPQKSILRQSIASWASTHLPDKDEIEGLEVGEIIAKLEPYDKGYVEFCWMVLGLDKHFENDCDPYLERKKALLAKHGERLAIAEQSDPGSSVVGRQTE